MVCRFTDAEEERADRRKRRVHRSKGTPHGSNGSHKTCQINTQRIQEGVRTHASHLLTLIYWDGR